MGWDRNHEKRRMAQFLGTGERTSFVGVEMLCQKLVPREAPSKALIFRALVKFPFLTAAS
jgi:hypothetical protein